MQAQFRDDHGLIEPDYLWESVGQAGEFDGKSKYTRNEYTAGNPGEVVWKEKKREDRLRRMVRGVTRIIAPDVENPARLVGLLLAAGVPRGGKRGSRTV